MKSISPEKFDAAGEDASSLERHVNDINTYKTTVLHTDENGDAVPVTTREICYSEGKFAAADVVQSVLNTQRGELQFDVTRGIPYLETIFSHPDRLMEWEREMRDAIEPLPFVDAIEEFTPIVERKNSTHRDSSLKVSYTSRIRTNLDETDASVDMKDGRTIRLHTFPVEQKPNWMVQKDADPTEFTVTVHGGESLLIRINCDRGTSVIWEDGDSSQFTIVGVQDTAITHTFKKRGTYTVSIGSGITHFTVDKNSIVKRVDRYSSRLTDLSYAFKDNIGIEEICEWTERVENISYCYSGCTALKGVRNVTNGTVHYTMPVYTDSIVYNVCTYEGCVSLLGGASIGGRTEETDALYMPARLHELGFFYNCYKGACSQIRNIVYQSWGGEIIDFTDNRYCTDFTVSGNSAFTIWTNLVSGYIVYDDGRDESELNSVSATSIANGESAKVITVSAGSGKHVRFSIGVSRIVCGTVVDSDGDGTLERSDSDTTSKVTGCNAISTLITDCDIMFEQSPIVRSCAFPASVKSAYAAFRNCTSLTTVDGLDGGTYWQNIQSVEECFCGCVNLAIGSTANLSPFPSSALSVRKCFYNCAKLTGNTPSLTGGIVDAESCFEGCALIGAGQFSLSWGGNLKSIKRTYFGCASLGAEAGLAFSIPSWNDATVTDATQCFAGCTSLACLLPLPPQDRVLKLAECFLGCTSLAVDLSLEKYRYDKWLIPRSFRVAENDSQTHSDYVKDCSDPVRRCYIVEWGGRRPNTPDDISENQYTEIFLNTIDANGDKITSLPLNMQFDGAGEFFITGLDTYPRIEDVEDDTFKQIVFDPTQTFGTDSASGVSTAIVRIVNSTASQKRLGCPFGTTKFDFLFSDKGVSQPISAEEGDFYISDGYTYLFADGSWKMYRFTFVKKESVSDLDGQDSSKMGWFAADGNGGTLLYTSGAVGGAVVNVNRYANTISNLDYAFYGATNLENICNWPQSLQSCAYCYFGCVNLVGKTEHKVPDWRGGTANCASCYEGCESLVSYSQSRLPNFSATTPCDASRCFKDCVAITALPGDWGAVVNASYCFSGCTSMGSEQSGGDLPSWNNVVYASHTFYGCVSLKAVMPAWMPNNVSEGKDYLPVVDHCFAGCSTLIANSENSDYATAHPDYLGGFSASVKEKKEQHRGAVENASAEVRLQFGPEWGGNFEFEPLEITIQSKKKITGFVRMYLSVNDLDIGTGAKVTTLGKPGTVNYAKEEGKDSLSLIARGVQPTLQDTATDIDLIGDFNEEEVAEGIAERSLGYEEVSDSFKVAAMKQVAEQTLQDSFDKTSASVTFIYKKKLLDGKIKVYNSDILGIAMGATKEEKKMLGTNATTTLNIKTARLPYITSVRDSANGCCVVFLPFTFYCQIRLKSVACNHLMVVGNYCFYGCTSLESVDLPSVEYVGQGAFQECSSLKSVNLERILFLGTKVFKNCKQLAELRLGSINRVTSGLLQNMSKLAELEIGTDNSACTVESDGIAKIGKSVTASCWFGSQTTFRTCALGSDKNYINEIYCPVGIEGFTYYEIFAAQNGGKFTLNAQLVSVDSESQLEGVGQYYSEIEIKTKNNTVRKVRGNLVAVDSIDSIETEGQFYIGTELEDNPPADAHGQKPVGELTADNTYTWIVEDGIIKRFKGRIADEPTVVYEGETEESEGTAITSDADIEGDENVGKYWEEESEKYIVLNDNNNVMNLFVDANLEGLSDSDPVPVFKERVDSAPFRVRITKSKTDKRWVENLEDPSETITPTDTEGAYNFGQKNRTGYFDYCVYYRTGAKSDQYIERTLRMSTLAELKTHKCYTLGTKKPGEYAERKCHASLDAYYYNEENKKLYYFSSLTSSSPSSVTIEEFADSRQDATTAGIAYFYTSIKDINNNELHTVPGRIVQCANLEAVELTNNGYAKPDSAVVHMNIGTKIALFNTLTNKNSYSSLKRNGDFVTARGAAYMSVYTGNKVETVYIDAVLEKVDVPIGDGSGVAVGSYNGDTKIVTEVNGDNKTIVTIGSLLTQVPKENQVTQEGYYYVHDPSETGSDISTDRVYQQICNYFYEACFYGVINGASSKNKVEIIFNGIVLFDEISDTQIKPYTNAVKFINRIFKKAKVDSKGNYTIQNTKVKNMGNVGKYVKIIDANNMMMTAFDVSRNLTVNMADATV